MQYIERYKNCPINGDLICADITRSVPYPQQATPRFFLLLDLCIVGLVEGRIQGLYRDPFFGSVPFCLALHVAYARIFLLALRRAYTRILFDSDAWLPDQLVRHGTSPMRSD